MANDNDAHEGWIDERLGALDAGGEYRPDVARARGRLSERERSATRQRRRRRVATTLAVASVALFAFPWPRAAAQRLLNLLFVSRVQVLEVRADLPESIRAIFDMQSWEEADPVPVTDIAVAERLAGFRPLMPGRDVLGETPQLSVRTRVARATKPLKTADIEAALAATGAVSQEVPRAWDGVALRVEGGPMVVARYPNAGIEIMQVPPLRMIVPAGFRFDLFMETAFLLFGRNADEARSFGAKFAANPALLMVTPPGAPWTVHEVALRSGPGTIVSHTDDGGWVCFFWNDADRLYIVSAPQLDDAAAVRLAHSMR